MVVEFASTQNDHPVKNELIHPPDNELGLFNTAISGPFEMWLNHTRSPKTRESFVAVFLLTQTSSSSTQKLTRQPGSLMA
jgi:hypothetical protein